MSELGNERSEPFLGDTALPPANTQSGIIDDNTEVDSDGSNADDEAIAGLGMTRTLSTITVGSEFYNHIKEHGRTYHVYKSGKYPLPNNKIEQERLDLQHELWLSTLEEELYIAPISEQLQAAGGGKVLDICTGTGIWAIGFAERHPATEVIGIDLSPIQPEYVSANLKFEIDNLEELWNFEDKFTFIHGRMMFACFTNSADVVVQAFHALKPGGYLEFQDALLWFRYDDRSMEGTAMAMWEEKLHDAAQKSSKDGLCSAKYKQYIEDAGFINIEEVHYKWPINPWPIDKHEKEMGELSLANLLLRLESFSMALLTRHLGISEQAVRELIELVEMEIKDERIHAYIPVSVVYGQKPK